MATSAQQATFAAQQGKSWADPNDPNFGQPGFIGQTEYQQYQQQNPGAPGAPGTPAPAGAPAITTQQQVQNTPATVGATTPAGQPSTIAQSYQQGLVNALNQGPISATSSVVAPSIAASRLATQRGLEDTRNQLAERAAATGTNLSGGFESQLLGAQQDAAARQAQLEANLIYGGQQEQDLNTRAALASAGGLLSGQAGLTQQQQLAELDAALRREGLAQQGQLGTADIGLRRTLGEGQLNLGLLSALLQNQQFGQSLSQQGSQFGQSLDAQTLLGLLNHF